MVRDQRRQFDLMFRVDSYVVHFRRDGGRVHRPLCPKRLDVIQRVGVEQLKETTALLTGDGGCRGRESRAASYLRGVILGGCDHHGEIHG